MGGTGGSRYKTKPGNVPCHDYQQSLCVFYRKLNQVNHPFSFPIHFFDDVVYDMYPKSKYSIAVDMCQNLLQVDSPFNQIYSSQDITSLQIQNQISKYYFEKYFVNSIEQSDNQPHHIQIIWVQLHQESLVIDYFLDLGKQSIKLSQPKSCAEHTDFTRLLSH